MGEFEDKLNKLLKKNKKTEKETDTEQKQKQFVKSYKPEYSFGKAFGTDSKQFFANLYRIPQSMWHLLKQGVESKYGGYDTSKPFWNQWSSYKSKFPTYSDYLKEYYMPNVLKPAATAIVPFPLQTVANLPYVDKTRFGQAIPDSPMSDVTNNLMFNSMIKNTGKWVYNPEAQTRRWFTPPSDPNSRFQELKERPFSTALEDMVNIGLVASPTLKGFGVGNKIAASPVGKYVSGSKFGQGVTSSTALVKKGAQYVPNKLIEKVGNAVAKWKMESEFRNMVTEFNRNNFSVKERILNPTNKRLMELGKDLPVEAQKYLFGILEGTEIYSSKTLANIFRGGAKQTLKAIGKSADFQTFKSNFDVALDYIGKKSLKQTNMLVKRGVLTAEQATRRAWMPAVKKYLVKTGRYTIEELDDILRKEQGFGKTLSDEFDLAIAEFDKYITELEGMGYKKPVYMPHHFTKSLKNADFFQQNPIYKRNPSFLKKTSGVSGYIEEPYVVWTRHELQLMKYDMTNRFVNKIVEKFGKPLTASGKAEFGYKPYYPEGFIKNMLSKNKKFTQVQLPSKIADEMNRVFSSTTELEKLLKVTFDPVTKAWKTSVLALSPRWLFNNFMGNMALNIAGGVLDPVAYINSFKKMRQAGKIIKEEGGSYNRAMAKVGIRSGVADAGLVNTEMRSALGGFANAAETSPVQNMFGKAMNYTGLPQIAKGMYRVNRSIENFYRIAHYLDKVGKGLSPSKALKSVNEFLFDYSALSVVEKRFIRRVVPFYTWQKNITRLVLSYPVKHSGGTAILQKLASIVPESEQAQDIRDGFLDPYLADYIKTPLKSSTGENLFLSARGMNPFADVGIATGNWQNYLASIHPIGKLILENMTGQSAYKGTQFSSPNRAYGSTEKIVPSLGRQILSNIPQATMIENLLFPYSKYDTGEPVLTKEGKAKYPKNRWLTLLKMFGVNLSPYDLESMKKQNISELMSKQTAMTKQAEKEKKFDKWEDLKKTLGIK